MTVRKKFLPVLMIFGAPVLWIGQMSIGEILTSFACYPNQQGFSVFLWNRLYLVLNSTSFFCFIGASVLGFCSWKMWKQKKLNEGTRAKNAPSESRDRFFKVIALMANIFFVISILFTACANILVSPCMLRQ